MARIVLVVLAAVTGAAGMALEIAAPRLAAPHVGTGALAWTLVIATFLAGLAAGNALGGRLADHWRVRGLLPLLLLAGAGVAAATPLLHAGVTGALEGWGLTARTLLGLPLAFLPVAFVLGMPAPVVTRGLLRRGPAPGMALGAASAASALGSVGGTLLAGFFLVPALGLTRVFLAVAGALVVSALLSVGVGPSAGPPPDRTRYVAPRRLWWGLAALAGGALLVLEIVAGRMAADRLGASVYAWTSVIGVVLGGLALGALIGGRLADRVRPRVLLPRLFVATSLATCLLLVAPALLDLADRWGASGALVWPAAVLSACTLAFFLPALAVGTLAPVVARAALGDPEADGRTVGALYAAGTLGAVAAALVCGTVLVPWAGLERTVLFLAFGLASTAGALGRRQPYLAYCVIVLLAIGVQGPWPEARSLARDLHLVERADNLVVEDSRYSRIRVREIAERWVPLEIPIDPVSLWRDPLLDHQAMLDDDDRLHWRGAMSIPQRNRLYELVATAEDERNVVRLHQSTLRPQRILLLDRLVHGYADLEDPTWLGYGYERLYDAVLAHLWPDGTPVRAFFVGGGAYAFQRSLLARHGEGVRLVTAEIDPRVTAIAREWLGLQDDARHRIVHADARTFVSRGAGADGPFDVVFGDAFDDIAVPFHLTTVEFARDLDARMAPGGIYLVNVVDDWERGRFLGAFVATLRAVFPHVAVVSALPRLVDQRDTFVVVASHVPLRLPVGELAATGGERAVRIPSVEVDALVERAGGRILTDDDAPVEMLLAPFLQSR